MLHDFTIERHVKIACKLIKGEVAQIIFRNNKTNFNVSKQKFIVDFDYNISFVIINGTMSSCIFSAMERPATHTRAFYP